MPEDGKVFNPIMTNNNKMEKPFNDMEKKPLTDEEEGDKGTIGGEESREKMEASKEVEWGEGAGEDTELNIFNQMKKKKKPKVFDRQLEDGIKDLKITEQTMEAMEEDGADLMFPAKKKKRSKKVHFDDGETQENDDALEGDKPPVRLALAPDSEREEYEELLDRLYSNMREKNPSMVPGEMKSFRWKPPQLFRVGTKKTSLVNFTDICRQFHRQPKHLMAFLLAELGTSGSIDGNNQLLIKGRFKAVQIEEILKGYIKEYVMCHACRSPKTILQKDTRLYFLQCETCHSRWCVSSIRTGFQALTGKRAQIRAKEN